MFRLVNRRNSRRHTLLLDFEGSISKRPRSRSIIFRFYGNQPHPRGSSIQRLNVHPNCSSSNSSSLSGGPLGLSGERVTPVVLWERTCFGKPGFGAAALWNRLFVGYEIVRYLVKPQFIPFLAGYQAAHDTRHDDAQAWNIHRWHHCWFLNGKSSSEAADPDSELTNACA